MNVVRGRADARWLPSRHAYALFRLVAFVRLSMSKPEPANVTMIIDEHQSAGETHAESDRVLKIECVTNIAFIAALLPWRLPLSIAVAIPMTLVFVHIPLWVAGLIISPIFVRDENRQRANSAVMLLIFFAEAVWFARQETWVRFAGWQVLVVVAINVIASALVFLLRGPIARMEARVTCAP